MDEALERKTVNRSDYVAPQRASHATTTWNIDPAHSAAQFNVRNMMASGRFDLGQANRRECLRVWQIAPGKRTCIGWSGQLPGWSVLRRPLP
jgi:hypothetical protein